MGSLIYFSPSRFRSFTRLLTTDRGTLVTAFTPVFPGGGFFVPMTTRLMKVSFTASGAQSGGGPMAQLRFRLRIDGTVIPNIVTSFFSDGNGLFASASFDVLTPITPGTRIVHVDFAKVAAGPTSMSILAATRPTTDHASLVISEAV